MARKSRGAALRAAVITSSYPRQNARLIAFRAMTTSYPKPPVEALLHRCLGFGFVLGLAACGGGGEPANTAATAVSPAATAASAPTSAAASTCGLNDFQASALAKVNQVRAAGATCGSRAFPSAAALSWNALLTQAAEGHSQDMVANDFFAHDSFDGRTFDQRITASGYHWSRVAENIAAGQTSVDEVMAGWMASEGHCVNIMNASLTEIGMVCVAGSASNTYGTYWAMDLGRPR
jgi:uncharacterized protein YkwD